MSMTDIPKTIPDLRAQIGTGAARAAHIFDRTLLNSLPPMPPAVRELNMAAHWGTFYGFALVEVLSMVAEHCDAEFVEDVLHAVNDIGVNGDDGRCVDVWPQIEQRLAEGGVGTPAWDAEYPPPPALPAGVTVRQEWGVHSADGSVYHVSGGDDTEAAAIREATLLYRGGVGPLGEATRSVLPEPGCAPAHRWVLEVPGGQPIVGGWTWPTQWAPPDEDAAR